MNQLVLNFKLDIFEGPLDLLLYLIRKNEFNIFDIPISEITSQYLEYLKVLEQIGIDTLADYMAMAALLMEIKSRLLIPKEKTESDEQSEDPRRPLVDMLLEYQLFQTAAENLQKRPMLERDEFKRSSPKVEEEAPIEELSPIELKRAYLELMSRQPSLKVQVEAVDVEEKVRELKDVLQKKREFFFNSILRGKSRFLKGVYFLALMDVIFRGFATAYQESLFKEILVRRSEG